MALIVCAALVATLSGCTRDAQGTLAIDRKTVADTTFVHIVSGSMWDTTARLVEELRIGKLDGPTEEMFGRISDVAPDGHGGIYVFDGQVPSLRHFDSTGRHVALLGRKGSGPGEYREVSGLRVGPDGRVFLHDPRNGRINIYGTDGKPQTQITVPTGLFTSNTLVIDSAGEIYVKALTGAIDHDKPMPIGLIHLAPGGRIIDSVNPPSLPNEPTGDGGTFTTSKVWEFSPKGYIVAGVSAAYRFELRKRDGKVVRIERDYTPVVVGAEEHAEREASNEWMRKTQGQFMSSDIPPVPRTKPAYAEFDIGDDGQIWVRPYVASVKIPPDDDAPAPSPDRPPPRTWREPATYDVFEPDGTYLGRLRLPDRVRLLAHRGDEVWGSATGASGELQLVRYRLTHRRTVP